MSQINFLPESFQRARRRQQRRPAEFVVIAGTLVALAGLWFYASGPDGAIAQQAEQLDQQLDAIAQMRAEQDRLYQERSQLQRQLMTARETYQPISATQVLSRLGALTPEPIRLLNIEIATERPAPEPLPDSQVSNKRIVGGATPSMPIAPNLMKITITGHAPSDDQLVTLIQRLDADPVFSSVALRSSKQDKTQTHFVRTFHLDVLIDLDRRFIDTRNGGPNHAD